MSHAKQHAPAEPVAAPESCRACRAFIHGEGHREGEGECHAHPPRAGDAGRARWPVTRDSDWCAEFTAAPAGREAIER